MKHPYLAMMGLFLGAFVGTFGETAMNVALPELAAIFEKHLTVDVLISTSEIYQVAGYRQE